jgi:hypothetical protein
MIVEQAETQLRVVLPIEEEELVHIKIFMGGERTPRKISVTVAVLRSDVIEKSAS